MKNLFLFLLKIYKKYFSPIISNRGVHCKYYPTCSEYSRQAITKYGGNVKKVITIKLLFQTK